jgi:hypothetical protein
MRKFLPLLICLSLSIFTVARAARPALTPAPDTKSTGKPPTRQQGDPKTFFKHANTEEEVPSNDDDSMDHAADDQGEDMNDEGDDTGSDEDTGDADGADDDGGDDNGGDQGE